MSLNNSINLVQIDSCYKEFNIQSLKDNIKVLFCREKKSILVKELVTKEHIYFDNYIDFSDSLVKKSYVDTSRVKSFTDDKFYNIYNRYNFIFYRDLIKDIVNTEKYFLSEFYKQVGLEYDSNKTLNSLDFKKINKVLNSLNSKGYEYLNKIEVELIIFIGDYIKKKYNGTWYVKKAFNKLEDTFYVPNIKVSGKEININQELFRYIYHPDFSDTNKEIDVEAFIFLIEFIINGNEIPTNVKNKKKKKDD